jgi:hypothetical protein
MTRDFVTWQLKGIDYGAWQLGLYLGITFMPGSILIIILCVAGGIIVSCILLGISIYSCEKVKINKIHDEQAA